MSDVTIVPSLQYATAFHVPAWSDLAQVVPPIAKTLATIAGRNATGDGGGGHFYWDATSTTVDDNGTVLNPGLGTNPGRWVRIHESHYVHASWWGVSAGNSDNSSGLQSAVNAIKTAGGTVLLPPGVLNFTATIDCTGAKHLSIEGASFTQSTDITSGTVLRYTPSTSVGGIYNPGLKAPSCNGFALRRIGFSANLPSSLPCSLVAFGQTSASPGNIVIEECWFDGNASTTCTGIFLGNVLNATIRDSSFQSLCYSVLGTTQVGITPNYPGQSDFSQEAFIEGCVFADAPIRNPGFVWTVDHCSWEGDALWPSGHGYAVDQDLAGNLSAQNFTLRGCFFADGSGMDVWVLLPHVNTAVFEKNSFGYGTRAIAVAGLNVNILHNDFIGPAVDFPATVLGVTILGNRGLVLTNASNAGIGLPGGAERFILANAPEGLYVPPVELSSPNPVAVPGGGGLKIGFDGTPTLRHYSVNVPSPVWSPTTVSNGSVGTIVLSLSSLGFLSGAPVGSTLVASLADASLPAGVFLFATMHVSTNGVLVSLVNLSGSNYTPTGALRVDIWVH